VFFPSKISWVEPSGTCPSLPSRFCAFLFLFKRLTCEQEEGEFGDSLDRGPLTPLCLRVVATAFLTSSEIVSYMVLDAPTSIISTSALSLSMDLAILFSSLAIPIFWASNKMYSPICGKSVFQLRYSAWT
jgi:hypothetical protein